jgi:NAD(P)-dependent dehydrogenase (short-subunit alcohol dehydrogenase family)
VDVTNHAQVEERIAEIGNRLGRVDILVNSAGVTGKTNVRSHEADIDNVRFVFDVNFMGSFYTSRAVLPWMLKRNLWTDPSHRVDRGQRGQRGDARIFGVESSGDWNDKGTGQGVCGDGHHHQCAGTGCHSNGDG